MARRSALRASDLDREHVAERLRNATAEGRLLASELEDRLTVALTARTYGELDALVSDLPVARERPRLGLGVRVAMGVALALAVLAVVALVALVLVGLAGAWVAWMVVMWVFFGRRGWRGGRRGCSGRPATAIRPATRAHRVPGGGRATL